MVDERFARILHLHVRWPLHVSYFGLFIFVYRFCYIECAINAISIGKIDVLRPIFKHELVCNCVNCFSVAVWTSEYYVIMFTVIVIVVQLK